jgi:hypothetical protein
LLNYLCGGESAGSEAAGGHDAKPNESTESLNSQQSDNSDSTHASGGESFKRKGSGPYVLVGKVSEELKPGLVGNTRLTGSLRNGCSTYTSPSLSIRAVRTWSKVCFTVTAALPKQTSDRDRSPLAGLSRTRIPTGLYGGRVGNKGGVGISLHFASARLLFVSVHLAAHGGQRAIENRKANVQRIKEGLEELDSFQDDSTAPNQAVDFFDRFDATFFFGDRK